MSLALLALACGLALFAGVVAGRDAANRGEQWLQAGAGVGCVVLFACSVLVLYTEPLVAAYASATGRPNSAVTPRTVVGLFGALGAAITVVVLAGYGVVTRNRAG